MSDTSVFERDRAYMLLLDLILSGELATEQALSERKLADNLQMGRICVCLRGQLTPSCNG